MKPRELRKKTEEELKKILIENREKLNKMSFDLSLEKLKNVREIRKIKKEIARILTILKEQFQKEHPTSEGGRKLPS